MFCENPLWRGKKKETPDLLSESEMTVDLDRWLTRSLTTSFPDKGNFFHQKIDVHVQVVPSWLVPDMEVFCTMFRHCSTESVTGGTLISGPNPHAFGLARKKAVLVFSLRSSASHTSRTLFGQFIGSFLCHPCSFGSQQLLPSITHKLSASFWAKSFPNILWTIRATCCVSSRIQVDASPDEQILLQAMHAWEWIVAKRIRIHIN